MFPSSVTPNLLFVCACMAPWRLHRSKVDHPDGSQIVECLLDDLGVDRGDPDKVSCCGTGWATTLHTLPLAQANSSFTPALLCPPCFFVLFRSATLCCFCFCFSFFFNFWSRTSLQLPPPPIVFFVLGLSSALPCFFLSFLLRTSIGGVKSALHSRTSRVHAFRVFPSPPLQRSRRLSGSKAFWASTWGGTLPRAPPSTRPPPYSPRRRKPRPRRARRRH